jgi:cyclic pyranopterin phosphate synthase|tara:strand:- start:5466 stop:5945 length:480 start_codon:yes stop_codon:yes gene_type:complete
MTELTHIGPDGRARMVDIGDKAITERVAVAQGKIGMAAATRTLAMNRETRKGDPIAIAELAGIMAAKKTADLIPLCHPLPLTNVEVRITSSEPDALKVTATVRTSGRTGVEMEALAAVSAACLTLYDMLKSADKEMVISDIELVSKTGGKSGDYHKENT